jgi:Uma2 family endonuclease
MAMAFLIDESFLPATLTAHPMTDEEFAAFCAEHPDLAFEMTAEGELLVMAPTFSFTGARNAAIIAQLTNWALGDGRGICLDSSTGFVLPNGARRSPDACWVSKKSVENLSTNSFWHLCPAFVIELKSESDRLPALRRKMQEWISCGAQLAWLIDPETQTVEIYRPDQEPQLVSDARSVQGDGPVEGFTLELARVWNPMA